MRPHTETRGFVGFNYPRTIEPALIEARRIISAMSVAPVSAASVCKALLVLGLQEPPTPSPAVVRTGAPFTGTLMPTLVYEEIQARADAEGVAFQQLAAHLLSCGLLVLVRDCGTLAALVRSAGLVDAAQPTTLVEEETT